MKAGESNGFAIYYSNENIYFMQVERFGGILKRTEYNIELQNLMFSQTALI